MNPGLRATIEPPAGDGGGEVVVTLRIVNESGATVEVLDPEIGRPSPEMGWPWSLAAYRAALLLSYGYLALAVTDAAGDEVEPEPVQTWATPVLRPPVALRPGEALEIPLPLGRFFPLTPGRTYRAAVDYGERGARVHAEGDVLAPP
jgi:hypothetical protein